MGLDLVLRNSLLDIEDVKLTLVIYSSYISDRNRRCLEGTTLNSERLLPFR
jgi:hypothetical protein